MLYELDLWPIPNQNYFEIINQSDTSQDSLDGGISPTHVYRQTTAQHTKTRNINSLSEIRTLDPFTQESKNDASDHKATVIITIILLKYLSGSSIIAQPDFLLW